MTGDSKKRKKQNGKIVILKNFFSRQKENMPGAQQKQATISAGEKRFYLLFATGIIAVSIALFMPTSSIKLKKVTVGEVSHRNVYAPRDILVEDSISTRLNRQHTFDSINDVYNLNLGSLRVITGRIHKAFENVRLGYILYMPEEYRFAIQDLEQSELEEIRESAKKKREYRARLRKFQSGPDFREMEDRFKETMGVELTPKTIKVLRWHSYNPQIGEWLKNILAERMQAGIVQQKDFLPESAMKGITVLNTDTGKVRDNVPLKDVYDMKEAMRYGRSRFYQLVPPQHPSLRRVAVNLFQQFIQPNLTYDKTKTLELKNAAQNSVSAVYFQVKKGELIVRAGEKITEEHLTKLQKIMTELEKGSRLQSLGGMALFMLLIVGISWIYMRLHLPEFSLVRSNIVLVGLIFVAQVALLRIFGISSEVFTTTRTDIDLSSYLFAAPFAIAPLLAAIFFSREITIMMTLVTAVSTGIIFPGSYYYFWVAIAGGLAPLFFVGRIKKRTDIWIVGLSLLAVNLLVITVAGMLDNGLFTAQTLHNLMFGSLGAFLVVALTLTSLPLIERFFPVVSDIKLRELLDLNHPLLGRMAVVAPGTYHHSVIVGNLAEEAAEAIGANPLLTRVGAYFHDIGKMDKPEYFIENQREGNNKHDSLNPSMSALIILSHVTRGLDMAKEYKLIPQISDMIAEHHGTQVIQYFYQRAKEQEKPGHTMVKEHDFRYSGQKPRTRESAIVALADQVEASSRTLKNPTSSRLTQLVFKIINNKFLEGQLDESHLTLYDLKKIGNSFVRILQGIFHHRVEYPEDKIDGEDTAEIQAGNQKPEQNENRKKTSPDIKETG